MITLVGKAWVFYRDMEGYQMQERIEALFDFSKYDVLSFDCYGTLIDWEGGIAAALRPVLAARNVDLSDAEILKLYADAEPRAQQEGGFVAYREVLRRVMREIANALGFEPSPSDVDCLADSIKDWMPFPDTVGALRAMKRRFKLAIISNVDDSLFADSAKRLEVDFDWIITSQQVGSYKPSRANFEFAIERMAVSPERLLHIAQSVYHDIVPAKAMGLTAVWVNRRSGKGDGGATMPANARPDLEVPDLKSLVTMMELDS